jgi:hypothetical protein
MVVRARVARTLVLAAGLLVWAPAPLAGAAEPDAGVLSAGSGRDEFDFVCTLRLLAPAADRLCAGSPAGCDEAASRASDRTST